jgi:hypothetical protein
LIVCATVIAVPARSDNETTAIEPVAIGEITLKRDGAKQLAQTCCKICRKGKACGNSCISRAKTCQKPPGCACDAK